MPLFICQKCGCIENTALGHYWSRKHIKFKEGSLPPELEGKALCSECTPTEYADGSKVSNGGEWHGSFEKVHWTKEYKKYPADSEGRIL